MKYFKPGFFILAWLLAGADLVYALTVTPLAPYSLVSKSSDYYVYYRGSSTVNSATATLGMFSDYRMFNVSWTRNSGTYLMENLIQFDVSSEKVFDETKDLYLSVHYCKSDTCKAIPITYFNLSGEPLIICIQANGCRGNITGSTAPGSAIPYAVSPKIEAEKTYRIGLYPKEICDAAKALGNIDTESCKDDGSGNVSDITLSTKRAVFSLRFGISTETYDANSEPSAFETTDDATQDTLKLKMVLHDTPPTSPVCPDGDPAFSNAYFPGDSRITLNTDVFSASEGFGAPSDYIVAVAAEGDLNVTAATYSNNPMVIPVKIGGNTVISGFTNTSNGSDHLYNMGVLLRDVSGSLNPCPTNYSGIQTSRVQGLIEKDHCFIATAVFGDLNHPIVRVFRKFRDRVLMQFEAGRVFTSWYYSWSPPAADWLKDHTLARGLVLAALLPVSLLALLILALGPLGFAGLSLGFIAAILGAFRRKEAA